MSDVPASAAPRRKLAFGGPSVLIAVAFVALAATVVQVTRGPVSDAMLVYVGRRLNALAAYLSAPSMLDGGRIYAFALLGGVVSSISPCILAMLPVNLSYIGSAKVRTRAAAVRLATLFVAGVIVVNTVLGLAGSLFFAVFVQYRGQVNVGVGIVTLAAALWMAGILKLRVPSAVTAVPAAMGPFAVGMTFALVTSPCSSPVLFTILAAAAKDGDPVRAAGAMAIYSAGYSAVLWLASVFAGIATASRRLLPHGELITRLSACALAAIGIGTIVYGARLLL
ncbi:MAG TPA: cytochrome c biogenesis CcdA family protein [Xanthomonadales bacterium]|nr:cytochrome c biogenesis CcdA family protein [Xanthomonadales bacterium]